MFEKIRNFFFGPRNMNYPTGEEYSYSTPFNDDRVLDYSTVFEFYRKNYTVRRLVNYLVEETLKEGLSDNDYYLTARLYLRHLILFGGVLAEKKSGELIDYRNMRAYQLSTRVQKLVYLEYDTGISTRILTAPELATVTTDSLNSTLGISPLEAAVDDLYSHSDFGTIKRNHFVNGGQPKTAIFIPKGAMTIDSIKREKNALAESMIGVDNAGKPFIAYTEDGKGNVHELKAAWASQEDVIFADLVRQAIADAFGVPVEYLNASQRVTLSEFRYSFIDEVVTGKTDSLAQLLELFFDQLGIKIKVNRRFSKTRQAKITFELKTKNAEAQLAFAGIKDTETSQPPAAALAEVGRPTREEQTKL